MSRRCPAWAYRGNESGNERLQISWSNSSEKEAAANMCGSRKVGPIGIFVARSFDHYRHRDQFREVIHGQAGKDLLKDKIRPFGMKVRERDGIFQLAEWSFDPPAHGIEMLKFIRREIKICQDGFKGWIGRFETDYAKWDDVRRNVKPFLLSMGRWSNI